MKNQSMTYQTFFTNLTIITRQTVSEVHLAANLFAKN